MSQIGAWMQVFALGILVVELAARDGTPERAPLYIGLVGLARAIPGLALTPMAGAVADRTERRRVLLVTQTTAALVAASLGALIALEAIALWHVLVAGMVASAAFAFDAPARHSMVANLVPRRTLPSAIGLQSAAFNAASIVGPLAAGLLYLPLGIAGLLFVNAAGFLAIIGALVAMSPRPPVTVPTHSMLRSVGEGLRYLRSNRATAWLLVLTASFVAVTGSFTALLPAIAGNSTAGGASWLSLLLAATGIGALTGSFVIMRFGRSPRIGRVYVGASVASGVGIVVFALSAQPLLALAAAYVTGLATTVTTGLTNNMLQVSVADEYRGRVMSLFVLQFIGILPAGQLALGVLGTALGIHAALVIGGVVATAVGLYAALRVGVVRDWQGRPHTTPSPRPPQGAPGSALVTREPAR